MTGAKLKLEWRNLKDGDPQHNSSFLDVLYLNDEAVYIADSQGNIVATMMLDEPRDNEMSSPSHCRLLISLAKGIDMNINTMDVEYDPAYIMSRDI